MLPIRTAWEECHVRFCERAHRTEMRVVLREPDRPYAKPGRGRDGFTGSLRQVAVSFHEVVTAWRRGDKLDERELQFWRTLHPRWKERILDKSAI
jgi:hypothetical protein